MVKYEIILLSIAVVAAYLFSTKKTQSGNVSIIDPFLDLHSKAQTQAINQNQNSINILESVRSSNLSIASNILESERNIADLNIAAQQTELDKTQGFIGRQQKFTASKAFSNLAPPQHGWQTNATALLRKFIGVNENNSLFPDFRLLANNENYNIVQQQANFELAQKNIAEAGAIATRQQGEIDRLNDEYQTRFGNLSRYG